MPSNEYHFITRWRVRGDIHAVADIIGDAEGLARWWPSVYLDVKVLEPGDQSGVGKLVELHTKGWLPYHLIWRFRVTDSSPPTTFSLDAMGDFNGRGVWIFAQDGDDVDIEYDWRITADKPLLKYLSFLMKPLFAANHRWAMDRGLESLKLELARRAAKTPADAQAIPSPPRPSGATPRGAAGIVAAGCVVVLGLFLAARRGKRDK